MALDLESLKKQLAETELEFEKARAHMYRCDGVVQLLKYQITEAEKSEKPSEDTSSTSV